MAKKLILVEVLNGSKDFKEFCKGCKFTNYVGEIAGCYLGIKGLDKKIELPESTLEIITKQFLDERPHK